MYGLKQSGMLANKELKKVLAKAGYFPSTHTPGLFVHKTRPISFTLVVDDFGVKYINKADALHLEKTIRDHYPMKSDWTGDRYIGIDLTGLHQQNSQTLHERLRQKSPPAIPTQRTHQTLCRTIPVHPTKLRPKTTDDQY